MLGMLGLAMVGSLAGQSITKGIAAALFGLLLAMIGLPEFGGVPRYNFDTLYLLSDLPLIPVLLGLFAVPEVMELAIKNISIAQTGSEEENRKGLMKGVRDAFSHWWLVFRCSVIGSYIGMLPGLGASIVGWVTYAHAKQGAKDDSQFGQGDVRGLLAPEAANNALRGGALIPTLTLGIPGSVGTAILMGALIMHGLRPGPGMLTTDLPITFSFVWIIALASVVATLILLRTVNFVAKVALLPGHLVVPGVVLFVFMGAWLGGSSMGAWISCFAFGVVGFLMKRGGWPRPPVVLALVLGSILERSFQISTDIHGGLSWMGRPIVLGILLLIVISTFFATRNIARQKREGNIPAGEGSERNPAISLLFSAMLFVVFSSAGYMALDWPPEVRQFPLLICVPGTILSMIVCIKDLISALETKKEMGSWREMLAEASKNAWLREAGEFFAYLGAMIILSLLVGQKLALPIFIVAYLVRWGGYSKSIALGYGIAAWVVLVFFYGQVMGLLFHPSYLAGMLQPLLPRGFAEWLIF